MRSSSLTSAACTSLSLVRWRFTRRFLRELGRIMMRRGSSSQTTKSTPPCCKEKMILQRYMGVKSAAEKSLASAVGKRRAWSRAVLARKVVLRRRSTIRTSSRKKRRSSPAVLDQEEAGELKKLVPGGEAMLEVNGLLEEAAHYIKCLHTQVQVMSSLANLLSAATTAPPPT